MKSKSNIEEVKEAVTAEAEALPAALKLSEQVGRSCIEKIEQFRNA